MTRLTLTGWFGLALVVAVVTISTCRMEPKKPATKSVPPVTTQEKILGELTLIRKMMEEDRKPVQLFLRDMKGGKVPPLPGVKR